MTNFTGPVKFKSEAWTKSKVKESSENCILFYFQVNSKVIKPNQTCIQMSPSKNDQIERIWKFLKEQIKGILANRPFLGWGLKNSHLHLNPQWKKTPMQDKRVLCTVLTKDNNASRVKHLPSHRKNILRAAAKLLVLTLCMPLNSPQLDCREVRHQTPQKK